MNYFECLNIPQTFAIDLKELHTKYLSIQKQLYFAMQDNNHGIVNSVENKIAKINIAYTTLLDPIKRAEYLLHINGVDTSNEVITDQEFLDKSFFLQEQFQNLFDKSHDIEMNKLVKDFHCKLLDLEKESILILENMFKNKDFTKICLHLSLLKSYAKMKLNIQEWL